MADQKPDFRWVDGGLTASSSRVETDFRRDKSISGEARNLWVQNPNDPSNPKKTQSTVVNVGDLWWLEKRFPAINSDRFHHPSR
jgi:hypothetical protein